jgi:hypothetical protein
MSFRPGNLLSRVTRSTGCPAHGERDLFAWSLLAALILLLLLALPFVAGGLHTADELGKFHLPARAFYAEQLAHGESFDWMPGVDSGSYLTGAGQVGTYHPLHRFLYRFLPLRAALGWEYLCSYPLMLLGMYFLLHRRLGRRDAAMVGGLAFTFSSFNLAHFVHPNAVATVAHIPWLLAMIDIVMVDAKRWKVALAQAFLALLTGSQILLGCPQYVWFSLLTEAGFTLWLVVARRYSPRDGCETMPTCRACIGCRRNSSPRVLVAKAVGLLVGAVQLLPTLEALSQSTSSGDLPEGATLHPINLVQLVAPYLPVDRAFGGNARELGLYVGAVPLMLAIWVLARRSDLGPLKRLAQVAAAFAAATLLLAFGSQGRSVHLSNSIPWAAWFQFSCRYTVLFQFAVAVLAAIGFVLVEREAREKQKLQRYLPLVEGRSRVVALWRRFEVLGATVLISLAVALAGLILRSGRQVAPVPYILVGPLLMLVAALLVMAAAQGVRGALIGLILFMAADLGFYGLGGTLDWPAVRFDGLSAQDWMQVPHPLPPVRLVTHVVPSQDPAEDLAKIDVRREALCECPLALPPGKPGTATLAQHGAGRMAVNVGCSSRQLLVIAESYHPGWRCMIDDSPRRVYRVNGDFLGCVVEPGDSEVHLAFFPDSLSRGRLVTLVGLGLIGICFVAGVSGRELALVEKVGLGREQP